MYSLTKPVNDPRFGRRHPFRCERSGLCLLVCLLFYLCECACVLLLLSLPYLYMHWSSDGSILFCSLSRSLILIFWLHFNSLLFLLTLQTLNSDLSISKNTQIYVHFLSTIGTEFFRLQATCLYKLIIDSLSF